MSAETHIQVLKPCVNSIMFLGAPHFGADFAGWAVLGTKLVDIVKRTTQEIVSVLQPRSETLGEIQKGFYNVMRSRVSQGSDIAITCFYEELPLPAIGIVS